MAVYLSKIAATMVGPMDVIVAVCTFRFFPL